MRRLLFFLTFPALFIWPSGELLARPNPAQLREQKVAEANAVLDLLKKKVASYEAVFKAVTALSAGSLSKEQILYVRNWSQNFQQEYNGLHEKLLDKEDQIYRLDQQIQGEDVDRYLQVSNNRFQELGNLGGNFTKQRVELHTYLEGEIDELNRQSSEASGLPAKRPRNAGGWDKIAQLLQAPAITADTPIQVAMPVPPPVAAPAPPMPAMPVKPPPAPQRAIANVPAPSSPPVSLPAKQLPVKQAIRFDEPEEPEMPIPPVKKSGSLPCPEMDAQALRQYRDGKTDLHQVFRHIGDLNRLIFKTERSEEEIDRRFFYYNHLLPLGFFDGKIGKNISQVDRKRWQHLNYLAQVRMISLYEEAMRESAVKIQKIFSGEDFDAAWGERLFAPGKFVVSDVGFSGGKACASVKALKQARNGCRLDVQVRFGSSLICRPNNPQLAQSAFQYRFAYSSEAERWVLDEVTVPLPSRDAVGATKVQFRSAFSQFQKRALNAKETVSTLESWIQQGLKSSDLLGYDGFLQRRAEENDRSIASKRDTLD